MEVCVLASGSKGNSIYVSGGGTSVLVDAGLSARELTARMERAGIAPESIQALLVTHDHEDHYFGVEVFSRKYPVRLFANEGTASGIEGRSRSFSCQWEIFETASTFEIGGLRIEAFTVPHDAADPVGFLLSDGVSRLCVVTDLGLGTPLVASKLAQCHAAILESNHDYDMLMESSRPWSLKTRIAGRSGHLSNDAAAELVGAAVPAHLHTLLLAHLSEACNTPELARDTMRRALLAAGRPDVRVEVLSQTQVSERFRV
ncbi:MAG: MBL fold metallo-hydrolase [Verrucomicrobiota bacterium]|jgi:phosphoribosyl 1,2-cyclic phosphodiesterase|nr:MBL fold metallo-hydrolase [Verrucomicrobiota bacterium]